MATAVVKMEPKSEGIATPRKKRPKELAVITECCTGCAGSPACVPYCPVADCMYWVPDEDHPPFGHIEVDPVAVHRLQEVRQQRSRRRVPGRLPVGCHRDGRHRRSRGDDRHEDAGLMALEIQQREREGITVLELKGRITVGPEASALRDKCSQLTGRGHEATSCSSSRTSITSTAPAWARW